MRLGAHTNPRSAHQVHIEVNISETPVGVEVGVEVVSWQSYTTHGVLSLSPSRSPSVLVITNRHNDYLGLVTPSQYLVNTIAAKVYAIYNIIAGPLDNTNLGRVNSISHITRASVYEDVVAKL